MTRVIQRIKNRAGAQKYPTLFDDNNSATTTLTHSGSHRGMGCFRSVDI